MNLKDEVLCNGERRVLIKEKRGKILKVEILRGIFIGYKDILPSNDLARSGRPASFLLKNVEFNITALAVTIKESRGKIFKHFS